MHAFITEHRLDCTPDVEKIRTQTDNAGVNLYLILKSGVQLRIKMSVSEYDQIVSDVQQLREGIVRELPL